jgi:hypothetical protein
MLVPNKTYETSIFSVSRPANNSSLSFTPSQSFVFGMRVGAKVSILNERDNPYSVRTNKVHVSLAFYNIIALPIPPATTTLNKAKLPHQASDFQHA